MIGSRRDRKATPLARIRGKFAEEVSEKCDNSAESQKLPSRVGQPRGHGGGADRVHADQAEAILQKVQADLVALAREVLYNPNWPIAPSTYRAGLGEPPSPERQA
jgi:2,4-dienoyl-CoA reductase-like NADH-dependent reductase (Old Yellow Enzyme family)